MTHEPKAQIDTQGMLTHLSRIMLRMVPFLPGPELYDFVKDMGKSRTDLDDKITYAQKALVETSEIIAELESGLKDRVAKVQRLKEEFAKYSELAEIEEEKAKAIIQQIDTSIGRNRGRERFIALALNVLAGLIVFGFGVAFGPSLQKWLGFTVK